MQSPPSPDPEIDDEVVKRYFNSGTGATAAEMSMMAHEHDLPSAAARYRLGKEIATVTSWLETQGTLRRVLDVGCGAGAWVEILSGRSESVVGIERSPVMADAATARIAHLPNAKILIGDGRHNLPAGPFDLVFVGGLCMYLQDSDVVALVRTLASLLSDRGVIILRESTIRDGVVRAKGNYQAIYRSVPRYRALFEAAGISCVDIQNNSGYAAMIMAESCVDLRRRWLPFLAQRSTVLGALTWWVLRGLAPLTFWAPPRIASALNIPWPRRQNHFFKLQPNR